MDPNAVMITIFFVGIAAFVNVPPYQHAEKLAIFPTARAGTYGAVQLTPHRTWLYVPGKAIADKDVLKNCVDVIQGTWDQSTELCTVELTGAEVWVRTSEAFVEDPTFRKIPSFAKSCPTAGDLPVRYIEEAVTPETVAARVAIRGGTAFGCKRQGGAFVTRLLVATNDGALYVRQNGRTSRILLTGAPAVTIENKPNDMTAGAHSHFGWYYWINRERISCEIKLPEPADVPDCPAMPGVLPMAMHSAAAGGGPDCSNSNYP